MSQQIDLKERERQAFRSTFQDGLWDIYLGLLFLAFGFAPIYNWLGMSETADMAFHTVYVLVIFLIIWLGKRYITVPRLGRAKFGPARKRRIIKTRVVLTGSVLLGLVAFALFATGNKVAVDLILLVFSANILIVFGTMAYFLDFDRLYIYAVLYALSLPVGQLLERHAGLPDADYIFFLSAGPTVIVGMVLFVRFMRNYPLPPDEEVPDGNPQP
jgi:hypothetical protein